MTIHVDPDQLYLASRTFWKANYLMVEDLYHLRGSLQRLESTWQGGPSAEGFLTDMHVLLQVCDERAEDLLSMSLVLSRQADRWEALDQRWSSVFRELLPQSPGD